MEEWRGIPWHLMVTPFIINLVFCLGFILYYYWQNDELSTSRRTPCLGIEGLNDESLDELYPACTKQERSVRLDQSATLNFTSKSLDNHVRHKL